MAGVKLRMPPGEFWQFLGESIGANPTPVAYAELYTALQTGTVDGQDNPLVASKLMKFYEVTSQFVLTGHVIGYDVMTISAKVWDAMKPDAAGQIPGRGREGDRRQHGEVQRAGKGSRRVLQEGGQEGLRARPDRLPHLRPEEIRRQIRQRLAEGRARAHQRDRISAIRKRLRPVGSTARPICAVAYGARQCSPPSAAGCGAAPRTSPSRCWRRCSLLHHPDLLPLRAEQPGRLDRRGQHPTWLWTVLWGAAFVLSEPEEVRFDIIYRRSLRKHAARLHGHHRHRADRPLWHLAAGGLYSYVSLHEGRALGLSARADQLAVFDLHHLRRRLHRPLLLAGLARHPGRHVARRPIPQR